MSPAPTTTEVEGASSLSISDTSDSKIVSPMKSDSGNEMNNLTSPTSVLDHHPQKDFEEGKESKVEDSSNSSLNLGNPQQGPSSSMTSKIVPPSKGSKAPSTTTATSRRPSKIVPPKRHQPSASTPDASSPQRTSRRSINTASATSAVVTPEQVSPTRKPRPVTGQQPFNLSSSNRTKKITRTNEGVTLFNNNNNSKSTDLSPVKGSSKRRQLTKPVAPKFATEARAAARPKPSHPQDSEETSVTSYKSMYTFTNSSSPRRTAGANGQPAYMQPTASSRSRFSKSDDRSASAPRGSQSSTAKSPRRRANGSTLTKPVAPKFLLDAKYGEKKTTPTVASPSRQGNADHHDGQSVTSNYHSSPTHHINHDDSMSVTSSATSRRQLTVPVAPKFRLDAKYGEKHLSNSSAVIS